MQSSIPNNLARVRERIIEAAKHAGRDANEITLIAVSKKQPVARIREASQAGQIHFGENYLQEAAVKIAELSDLKLDWHAIGAIQSNKIKVVVEKFNWFHGLCTESQIDALEKCSNQIKTKVLVQINVAKEPTKSGLIPEQLKPFMERIAKSGRLTICGLMCIPPISVKPGDNRRHFAVMRQLADRVNSWQLPLIHCQHLSMGMSDDYVDAILEGATLIRVGQAIFGKRPE